jgi:hypothetical protein
MGLVCCRAVDSLDKIFTGKVIGLRIVAHKVSPNILF